MFINSQTGELNLPPEDGEDLALVTVLARLYAVISVVLVSETLADVP